MNGQTDKEASKQICKQIDREIDRQKENLTEENLISKQTAHTINIENILCLCMYTQKIDTWCNIYVYILKQKS